MAVIHWRERKLKKVPHAAAKAIKRLQSSGKDGAEAKIRQIIADLSGRSRNGHPANHVRERPLLQPFRRAIASYRGQSAP
ncbi:MAG TPA: hypothetical protein VJK26_03765 [Patescibacteria group bacterium]|nr:hypothetical protein [Patescibacteria group bacterium]